MSTRKITYQLLHKKTVFTSAVQQACEINQFNTLFENVQ